MIPSVTIGAFLFLILGLYVFRNGGLAFFGGFLVSCSLPLALWASGLGGGATAVWSGIPILYSWAGLSIRRER